MRRSICYCEPNVALAGDVSTWKFTYTTATALPKGTRMRFDLMTKGRDIDWQIPQVNPKDKKNLIWAEMPGGKAIAARQLELPNTFVPAYEFTLPAEIKAGETFIVLIGTPSASRDEMQKAGNRAQSTVQRRRPFHLFIDPKGKGEYREPEVFNMDVRGNALHDIRIIAPSIVSKNKRFDVVVRFEDCFGNLTNNAPEGTLIELSHEHLRENLSWKLFVPETGFINLPNIYFNETGIYRIQLRNTKNNDKFYSAPIKCFSDMDRSIYWGLLHGESERVDSIENVEAYLRHFRDEKSMQFFASSPFESVEEISNETWKSLCLQVAEFNEENRFTTFLGFQWCGTPGEEGLRHIIYLKDNKPILRKKDSKTNILKKIYKSHTPKDLIAVPSFTMAKGFHSNFEDFAPEFERVVEIYNAWGSSECSAKEGNPKPIAADGKTGISETDEGSIRKALNRNCRFGFVAGGLDDRGIYNGLYESDQIQYAPGLTAIIAIEQSRDALLQALYNRSCYATTGERIILGFAIAGAQMGSELNTKLKPGLIFNRHITGYICGLSEIAEVAIIRNGKVLQTFNPKSDAFDLLFDDTDPLAQVVLSSTEERPPFVYYYMRVIQENGEMGWTSPIWIDFPDINSATTLTAKKPKKKA